MPCTAAAGGRRNLKFEEVWSCCNIYFTIMNDHTASSTTETSKETMFEADTTNKLKSQVNRRSKLPVQIGKCTGGGGFCGGIRQPLKSQHSADQISLKNQVPVLAEKPVHSETSKDKENKKRTALVKPQDMQQRYGFLWSTSVIGKTSLNWGNTKFLRFSVVVKDLRFDNKDLRLEDKDAESRTWSPRTRSKTCKLALDYPQGQGLHSRTTTLG